MGAETSRPGSFHAILVGERAEKICAEDNSGLVKVGGFI